MNMSCSAPGKLHINLTDTCYTFPSQNCIVNDKSRFNCQKHSYTYISRPILLHFALVLQQNSTTSLRVWSCPPDAPARLVEASNHTGILHACSPYGSGIFISALQFACVFLIIDNKDSSSGYSF